MQEKTKEITSVEEGHDVERVVETSAAVKLAKKQVQQIQYIDRVMDDSSCARKWQLLLSREACVFLKPVTSKIELVPWMNSSNDSEGAVGMKSLDLVDETRAKWL